MCVFMIVTSKYETAAVTIARKHEVVSNNNRLKRNKQTRLCVVLCVVYVYVSYVFKNIFKCLFISVNNLQEGEEVELNYVALDFPSRKSSRWKSKNESPECTIYSGIGEGQ